MKDIFELFLLALECAVVMSAAFFFALFALSAIRAFKDAVKQIIKAK